MDNSFRTYQKSNKFRISFGTILVISFFVCIGILLLQQEFSLFQSGFIEKLLRIVGISILVLLFYRIFKSFNEREKLNGQITGTVKLFSDNILFNNQCIKLNEINQLKIQALDFQDKRHFILLDTWYPSLSNGFDNRIIITLLNNENIEINFEQHYDNEFSRKNKGILIEYHKAGKLSLLNLLDILQIEDYDEIQYFKKSLVAK